LSESTQRTRLATGLHDPRRQEAVTLSNRLIHRQRVEPTLHGAQPTQPTGPGIVLNRKQHSKVQLRQTHHTDRQLTRKWRHIVGNQHAGV
jgi:hypothetical protein